MNIQHINNLLEKYWDAETSLQEEQELSTYFSSNEVAEEHKSFIPLFSNITDMQEVEPSIDVRAILEKASNDVAADEIPESFWNAETSLEEEKELHRKYSSNVYFKFISLFKSVKSDVDVSSTLKKQVQGGGARVISFKKWAVSIAAILIFGLAITQVMNVIDSDTPSNANYVEFNDPDETEEALEVTKQALALLSKKMNKGSQAVVESVSNAEKADIFK